MKPKTYSLTRVFELIDRVKELEEAAKNVTDYDWSSNDDDAVLAVDRLRRLL